MSGATQGHLFSEEVETDLPLRDNGVHFYYEEDLFSCCATTAQRCGLRCGGRESRIAGDPRQITASLPPRKRWPLRATPSRVRRWRGEPAHQLRPQGRQVQRCSCRWEGGRLPAPGSGAESCRLNLRAGIGEGGGGVVRGTAQEPLRAEMVAAMAKGTE